MSKNVIQFVLTAKDKMSKPMGIAAKSIKGISNTVFSLKGALGGLAIGMVAESFVDAANTTEQLNVRLGVLLGSVEEGNKLFKDMTEFAGTVPFEFEQIMEGSARLSTVLEGGAEAVKNLMPAIADVAAASGLTIQETSDQFARAYSAGLGAADLFRDRGVKDLLDIKDAAGLTGKEFEKAFVDAATKSTSKVSGAAIKLSTTWTGIMSMISDKWFAIRTTIMDAGVMDFIKAIGITVDKFMGNALTGVKENASNLTSQIIEFANGFASFMGVIATIGRGVRIAFNAVYLVIQSVVATIYNIFSAVGQAYVDFRKLLDEDYQEPTFLKVLNAATQNATKGAIETKKTIADLATSKWPATGIENFKNQVVSSFTQLRGESERTKNAMDKVTGGGDMSKAERTAMSERAKLKDAEDEKDRQRLTNKFVSLSESFLTERELVQAKYEQDLVDLDTSLLVTNMTIQQYQTLKEQMEIKHQENLANTRKNALRGSFAFAQAIRKRDLAGALSSGQQMLGQLATQNKTAFRIQKGLALAKAIVTLPSAVMQSYDNGGGFPWGLIPAGLMLATGLMNINKIRSTSYSGQAHAGLTNVPREGTYLLDKGERVIQPSQNRDLTNFLDSGEGGNGSVTIENLNISILENATSGDALMEMNRSDIEEVLAAKFIPALNALSRRGIVQDAIAQAEDS